MDVNTYNRAAWDKAVERGNTWTIPVDPAAIARARRGEPGVKLTPTTPAPRDWLPRLAGLRVLCLAGGGGQQGPLLAAAGARVTVVDISPRQLEQDRLVAEREGLELTLVAADMMDLGVLAASAFDLIVNPCSSCFVPDVRVVWQECARVLVEGGVLLSGHVNPVAYTFDQDLKRTQSVLQLKYAVPYSDLSSIPPEERARYTSYQAPLEFGHSLTDLLGAQMAAGFALTGFYEDTWGGADEVDRFFPAFLATRAVKMGR
jgi:SAM-dependent methyltransferase